MTSNRKLTGVLKGRTIATAGGDGGQLTIRFTDGSTMTIKAASAPPVPASKTVAKARQQGTQLALDMDDGSTVMITMAEPTSSVMVRAPDRTLEYAD